MLKEVSMRRFLRVQPLIRVRIRKMSVDVGGMRIAYRNDSFDVGGNISCNIISNRSIHSRLGRILIKAQRPPRALLRREIEAED